MSVPLSAYRSFSCDDIEDNECKYHASDIFLDAEERYEIFVVKSAERSHLLTYQEDEKEVVDADACKEEKVEESSSFDDIPPLIDGCDISGWRKESLVTCTSEHQGILNIGASSTMFRRESQWPIFQEQDEEEIEKKFGKTALHMPPSTWDAMKMKLMTDTNIRRSADIIHHDEYKQLVPVEGTIPGPKDDQSRNYAMASKFAIEYEKRNIPATILGATDGWKCMPTYSTCHDSDELRGQGRSQGEGGWTFSNLLHRFRHVYWRFSDTHGEMMSFGTYAKYISNLEGLLDDSPLGIYDSEFGDEDSPTHELLEEYTIPSCFSPDLFDLADNSTDGDNEINEEEDNDGDDSSTASSTSTSNISSTRPPYRWILIGPERSGTGMHIDPLWTNAWVTVLQGKKRWMLFPPIVPLEEIGMIEGQPQMNSATWFKLYYDKVVADDFPEEWRPVEVLQVPGETVFVPNGWPHLVLNLELTVAVTHNYASEFGPFERMWTEVEEDEPNFAARWMQGMNHSRQDLVDRLRKSGAVE